MSGGKARSDRAKSQRVTSPEHKTPSAPALIDEPESVAHREILGHDTYEIYVRLCNDARTLSVKTLLINRGMSTEKFDLLLQTICVFPRLYASQSNLDTRHFPELERIGKTLRGLAADHCRVPGVGDFLVDLELTERRPDAPRRYRSLRAILDSVASQIGRVVQEHRAQNEAGAAWRMKARGTNRPRSISVRSQVILGIYDAVNSLLPTEPESGPPRRAHNKETAILASVVLQAAVIPNEVSQLRVGMRRTYAR